jgi:hypothetical protein
LLISQGQSMNAGGTREQAKALAKRFKLEPDYVWDASEGKFFSLTESHQLIHD